jgi:hypothetical protein
MSQVGWESREPCAKVLKNGRSILEGLTTIDELEAHVGGKEAAEAFGVTRVPCRVERGPVLCYRHAGCGGALYGVLPVRLDRRGR